MPAGVGGGAVLTPPLVAEVVLVVVEVLAWVVLRLWCPVRVCVAWVAVELEVIVVLAESEAAFADVAVEEECADPPPQPARATARPGERHGERHVEQRGGRG